MPWDPVVLNDGNVMPTIAYGTWKLGNGQAPVDKVDQALSVGFDHIDTAQAYRNETEAGTALRESGLSRSDVYITTKYSGLDGLDVETSIQNSLRNLGVSYVDLYLVHSPRLAVPDIPTLWSKMEKIKSAGYAKSIGVSNFKIEHLDSLLASAKVKPAANQIMLHPYNYAEQTPLMAYCALHGIVVEGYSPLIPLIHYPGGPVDVPVNAISSRLSVAPEQVLIAWAKAKGAVPVTSSSKKDRMERYIAAGDIELTTADVASIDAAGAAGARRSIVETVLGVIAVSSLTVAAVLRFFAVLNIPIL